MAWAGSGHRRTALDMHGMGWDGLTTPKLRSLAFASHQISQGTRTRTRTWTWGDLQLLLLPLHSLTPLSTTCLSTVVGLDAPVSSRNSVARLGAFEPSSCTWGCSRRRTGWRGVCRLPTVSSRYSLHPSISVYYAAKVETSFALTADYLLIGLCQPWISRTDIDSSRRNG